MVEKQFTGHLKGRIALVTGGCGGNMQPFS